MPSRLSPCPSCTRHFKVGASSCPFCGGAVPTDVPVRVFARSAKPLTRAAILFAGATAVSACGDVAASLPPGTSQDASPSGQDGSPRTVADSSPPPHDAGHDADTGMTFPVLYGPASVPDADMMGDFDAAYGGFVHPEAGEGFDSGPTVTDASPDGGVTSEDAGQGFAAYGGFANPDSGF